MLKLFDAVSKTAIIFLDNTNFTLKKYQNARFELLQHHIKFHPEKNLSQ